MENDKATAPDWRKTNELNKQLDEAIARREPPALALGVIRELNGDNDVNYPFTERQAELLTQEFAKLKALGIDVTPALLEEIAAEDEGGPVDAYELQAILTDIAEGVDENGEQLPEREQPFHFNSYPYACKR